MNNPNIVSEESGFGPTLSVSRRPSPSNSQSGWMRRLCGSVLAFVGFMLSPFSWWNDLVLNWPLAVGFAWVVARFYPPAFCGAMVVGYLLTNVLGLMLMDVGYRLLKKQPPKISFSKRDLCLTLAYTAIVLLLVHLGILHPAEDSAKVWRTLTSRG